MITLCTALAGGDVIASSIGRPMLRPPPVMPELAPTPTIVLSEVTLCIGPGSVIMPLTQMFSGPGLGDRGEELGRGVDGDGRPARAAGGAVLAPGVDRGEADRRRARVERRPGRRQRRPPVGVVGRRRCRLTVGRPSTSSKEALAYDVASADPAGGERAVGGRDHLRAVDVAAQRAAGRLEPQRVPGADGHRRRRRCRARSATPPARLTSCTRAGAGQHQRVVVGCWSAPGRSRRRTGWRRRSRSA